MVSCLTRTRLSAVALMGVACASGAGAPAASPSVSEAAPGGASQPMASVTDASATEPAAEPQSEVASGPEEPASSEEALGPDPEASAARSGEDATESESPSNPAPAAASAPEPEPAARPSAIVTAPGVIYILDYQASDVSKVAREKCDQEAGEDMEKRAECLKKARDKFRADALRFKRSSQGKLKWHIYRRDGDGFKEVHLTRFEFADESAKQVTLIPKGGAMGARPLFRGRRKVVLGVPSTYSLIIEDPRHGRLVYKARFESGGG